MLDSVMTGLLMLGAATQSEVSYQVISEESRMTIEVGRAGFLKMFGHDHLIEVGALEGSVSWNAESPRESRFILEVDASSLTVADAELGEDDRAKIQSDMETKALLLGEHPMIRFESSATKLVKKDEGIYRLEIAGSLSLRGVEKDLVVPASVEIKGDRMFARGALELPSDEWGVPEISVAGGSVKTKKELKIAFEIVARPRETSSSSRPSPDLVDSREGAPEPP
ncbi:MAG TPA: YceI family protein [Vicinamibacteria bacterium]|nr:YceI family protein [Vicinamibacteria bacterium]